MNIKELFQELQDHQFDCLTFMKVTQCKYAFILKIVPIMTDYELRALTISFDNKIESLKQQGTNNKLERRVSRAYKIFLDEKRRVQLHRRIPGKSTSSQVKEFFQIKIPLAIIILLIVNDNFQTDNQGYSKQFWIVFGILLAVLLLDLLDIYFKWENSRKPASYQARLQDGGIFPKIKDIAKWICSIFSPTAQNLNNFVNENGQQEVAGMREEDTEVEENKEAQGLQENEDDLRQIYRIELAGVTIHDDQSLNKSLLS